MHGDATTRLLTTVQRRLWLQGLVDRGWSALLLAAGLLGLAAAVHMFFMSLSAAWWSSAVLLAIAAALLAAAVNRPTPEAAAATADRWLDAQQLFSAARYLRSSDTGPASTAARIVLDRAERTAAEAAGRLPGIRSPGRPLPALLAVAVAASSLFFLSLHGAAPAGTGSAPLAGPVQAHERAPEDPWLSLLDEGLAADTPVTGRPPVARESGGAASAAALAPGRPSRPAPDAVAPGESDAGPAGQPETRYAAPGSGAGRLASGEPARPGPAAGIGAAAPGDVQFVAVPRALADQATATDRTTSVGLLPPDGKPARHDAAGQGAPAARLAGQSPAPAVGPAHRALQARYFEEIARDE